MFQHILVPLDGSTRSEQAIPVAARIARASRGSITLLYVVTPPIHHDLIASEPHALVEHAWENEREGRLVEARHYLTCVAANEYLEGVGVHLVVEVGAPGSVIVEYTNNVQIELVVMCSHGRTGFTRWALGSVALKVARLSVAPVLILRENKVHADQPTQVLLALDETAEGEEALLPASQLSAALAAPAPGRLHLSCLLHLPTIRNSRLEKGAQEQEQALQRTQAYLARVRQRLYRGDLAHLKLEVTSSVIEDTDVSEALVRIAEIGDESEGIEGSSIIAMATHTPDSLLQRIMGSITEQVLNGTRLPMLIVHPRTGRGNDMQTHETHGVSAKVPAHV